MMMTTTRTWPLERRHLIGVVALLAVLHLVASPVLSAHGTNIVSFNGGVEIGQFLALTAVLLALGYWPYHRDDYEGDGEDT